MKYVVSNAYISKKKKSFLKLSSIQKLNITHLKVYYSKMVEVIHDEKLLILLF